MYKVRHTIELEITGENATKVNNVINYIESIIEDENLGVIESTETSVIED